MRIRYLSKEVPDQYTRPGRALYVVRQESLDFWHTDVFLSYAIHPNGTFEYLTGLGIIQVVRRRPCKHLFTTIRPHGKEVSGSISLDVDQVNASKGGCVRRVKL